MESFLGRYRNLTILVGVLFLQVLGLAMQVKRSGDSENTRLIRVWAVDAVTPFERALVWVQQSGGNLWHNYFYLRGVRAENRELKQQIDQMRLEQVRLNEDAEQARRLQALLGFKEQFIEEGDTVAAQVIGTSGNDLSQSIYIDKGSNEGIKTDMAVITADGIVGKVLHAYPTTSQVLMINDQTSGVGAMLEKTRVQGVLKGTPNASVVLERVMSDEKVSPGDVVLSSGGDQIFPKGLPVGTVTKVSPGHEMFLNIQVKPAADLSRLEEVLVVTAKHEREAPTENAGRVRAADILAQRLPSVPDKPADATPRNTQAEAKPQNAVSTAANASDGQHTAGNSTASASPTAPNLTAKKTGANPSSSANAANTASTNKITPASKPSTSNSATSNSASSNSVTSNSASSLPKSMTTHPATSNPSPITQPPTQDDPH
jgi:rod shape-determining protein MreC